jgi:two-component system, OmpR family, sensor histidine kinase VicK
VWVGLEGEEVVFSVTDTGKGINKEDLARLFTKFTRVGGASRFHTEGTGLGLYVAKQIVNEHHGDVYADSPGEGKGSTFAMSLPVEGAPRSLKAGEKAEVVIKAAEAQGKE